MSNVQLFYCLPPGATPQPPPALPAEAGYRSELWKPHGLGLKPPGLPALPFVVWGALHQLRVFGNRDYALQLITLNGETVHRSGIFPPYFRFPFMARDDLQIGDTWTRDDQRGRGLAVHALLQAVHALRRPGRSFWYLCDEDNVASRRVVLKANFRLLGKGVRTKRLGLRLLGSFQITQPNA